MSKVTVRTLRNEGGRVLDRVMRGTVVTVTRDGEPVAELRPLARRGLSGDVLLRRWRRLPLVDPLAWRADVDGVVESAL